MGHRVGSESTGQRRWQSFAKRVIGAGESESEVRPKSGGFFRPPRTRSEAAPPSSGRELPPGSRDRKQRGLGRH